MVALGVLRCPVCERVCFYQKPTGTTRGHLKEMASSHLSSHRLDESKRGIYRVMMADNSTQVEMNDTTATPVRDWIQPAETLSQAVRSEIES